MNESIRKKNSDDLKKKISKFLKLEDLKYETSSDMKSYINSMSINQARMHFKLRTHFFKCLMSYMSDPVNKAELWCCDACKNVDTQAHILWYPEYNKFREGKSPNSDKDIV